MNRSQSRIIEMGRLKIEKELERTKKRMNKLYVMVLEYEEALKLFVPLSAEEVTEEANKEVELRKEIVSEIEKIEENPVEEMK